MQMTEEIIEIVQVQDFKEVLRNIQKFCDDFDEETPIIELYAYLDSILDHLGKKSAELEKQLSKYDALHQHN